MENESLKKKAEEILKDLKGLMKKHHFTPGKFPIYLEDICDSNGDYVKITADLYRDLYSRIYSEDGEILATVDGDKKELK